MSDPRSRETCRTTAPTAEFGDPRPLDDKSGPERFRQESERWTVAGFEVPARRSTAIGMTQCGSDTLPERHRTLATAPEIDGKWGIRRSVGRFFANTRARCLVALLVLAVSATIVSPQPSTAADSASVIIYHRFGEEKYRSTNIRLEQFEAHVSELSDPRYNVLPLPHIVDSLQNGKALPDRSLAITIDDAFLSVYTEAWPRLRAAGLPFTLFVATQAVDVNRPNYMSWDQIRQLHRAGVTIGSQTHTHLDMPVASAEKNRQELEASNRSFLENLGVVPDIIAYPFGQYSLAVRTVVIDAGFRAGFGQHSGIVHSGSDMFYLPRFAMNEIFGDIERLRIVANALPLRVRDFVPVDPLISPAANPPAVGFTVANELTRQLGRLRCYGNSGGELTLELLGPRVEIRFAAALPEGRSRINCTMPAPNGRWRWFGKQFYLPNP